MTLSARNLNLHYDKSITSFKKNLALRLHPYRYRYRYRYDFNLLLGRQKVVIVIVYYENDKALYLGIHHLLDIVGVVLLQLLQVAGPGLLNPVNLNQITINQSVNQLNWHPVTRSRVADPDPTQFLKI